MGGILEALGGWDPLGLSGEGGATVGGGILFGPLGLLGGLFGGGSSEGGTTSGGSGAYPGTPNVLGQLMPLFMLALVAYLVIKFLPKLLK